MKAECIRKIERAPGKGPRLKATHLLISFCFLALVNAQAQDRAAIIGRVVDAADKSPLWGANVLIKGTSIGTVSDDAGRFKITLASGGKVTLAVRYVGFTTVEKVVDVPSDGTRSVEIALKATVIEGQEFVVTAQLQGQQAAINQQLNSNTIVNIVSKDKIQELPDQNAAETLSRLPGISLQRDAGEGQKIIIRGLAPKYNTITINNEKIPATDIEDRSVDLSSISSDMLAGIEVYKSLTPDKDGDAVGGAVNFTVKKAPSGYQADVRAQDAYNAHEQDYGNYKASVSVSNRFFDDQLGLVVTGNAQDANRGSDAQDVGYIFLKDQAGASTSSKINVQELNLTDRLEQRKRYGASLVMDYNLGTNSFLFSGFWSKTDRDQTMRAKNYKAAAAETEYQYSKTKINLQLYSLNLSGEHTLGFLELNWRAALSRSEQKTPFEFSNDFSETGAFNSSLVLDKGPEFIPLAAINNLDATTFEHSYLDQRNMAEMNRTVVLDAKMTYSFGDILSGSLKFGTKYATKSRHRENNSLWTDNLGLDKFGLLMYRSPGLFSQLYDETGDRKVRMTNFISKDDLVGNFMKNRYAFGPSLDGAAMEGFLNAYRNFMLSPTSPLWIDNIEMLLQNYDASEAILAGYVLSEIQLGPQLFILPGVRYERTSNDYKSIFGTPSTDEDATPNLIGARDTLGARTYDDFLPMVQMKLKVTDWFDIRAAVTKSLSRPDYYELVPREYILIKNQTINKGNSSLAHTRIWNYDLFLSAYNQYGLFTIGGFYKKLWDVDYLRTSRIVGGRYNGWQLTQPVNADLPSTVYGAEIELQANLTLLPNPFDGIVLYANLSLMKSKTYFPFFEIGPRLPVYPYTPTIIDTLREGPMPGQANAIGNVAVGYEKSGFSGRLSLVFQGKSLSLVAQRPELDGYTDESFRWDVALQQQIWEGLSIFVNGNNLTDIPERSFLGAVNFPTNEQYFGWSVYVGVRYKF